MFDLLREDYRAYNGDLSRRGLWCMVTYRFGNWRYTIGPSWLRKPFSLAYKVMKVFSEIITQVELPCEAKVGRRLIIEHAFDVVVSGDAVLGDDVVLRNGVTIGLRHRGKRGSPVLGDRVDVGAGAKLLGPIHIGDDAVIGANAVVICDVPAGYIAVGVPARPRARASKDAQPALAEAATEIPEVGSIETSVDTVLQ